MFWKYVVMSTLVLIPNELKQRSEKAPGPLSSPVDFLRMRMHPHFIPPIHFPCMTSIHCVRQHQSFKPSYYSIHGWQQMQTINWNQLLHDQNNMASTNGQWHLQEWLHWVCTVQDCNQSQGFNWERRGWWWASAWKSPQQEQEAEPQGLPSKHF